MLRPRSAYTFIQVIIALSVVGVIAGGLAAFLLSGKRENQGAGSTQTDPSPRDTSSNSLSAEDHQLIEKQKNCPVSGQSLGSMDGPYRDEVDGKVVFLCCKSCTKSLHKDPAKYLEKLK
jgi:YHS domain-containing protein